MEHFEAYSYVIFAKGTVYHKRRSNTHTVCGINVLPKMKGTWASRMFWRKLPKGYRLCESCHLVGVYKVARDAIADAQKESR